jgi:hypothetical protein
VPDPSQRPELMGEILSAAAGRFALKEGTSRYESTLARTPPQVRAVVPGHLRRRGPSGAAGGTEPLAGRVTGPKRRGPPGFPRAGRHSSSCRCFSAITASIPASRSLRLKAGARPRGPASRSPAVPKSFMTFRTAM